MTHSVILQRLAAADLRGYFDYAARNSRQSALRWLDRFEGALRTLSERPERCRLAWENGRVDVELREFLFGRRPYVFRVIFTIDGACVRILRIRRSQRRRLSPEELRLALDDLGSPD